jgi:hypothetical protein
VYGHFIFIPDIKLQLDLLQLFRQEADASPSYKLNFEGMHDASLSNYSESTLPPTPLLVK